LIKLDRSSSLIDCGVYPVFLSSPSVFAFAMYACDYRVEIENTERLILFLIETNENLEFSLPE